jgi:hypothetical protein
VLKSGKIPAQGFLIGEELIYNGPDDDQFASFALIMRKFISPREDICFGRIANVLRRLTGEKHPDILEHINCWQQYFKSVIKAPVMVIKRGIPPTLEKLIEMNPDLNDSVFGHIFRKHTQGPQAEFDLGRSECFEIYMNGLLFHADPKKRQIFDFIESEGLLPVVMMNARDTLLRYINPVLQLEFAIKMLFEREPQLNAEYPMPWL